MHKKKKDPCLQSSWYDCRAIDGHWQLVASGRRQLLVAIGGQWPLMATDGHWWPLMAIDGVKVPSSLTQSILKTCVMNCFYSLSLRNVDLPAKRMNRRKASDDMHITITSVPNNSSSCSFQITLLCHHVVENVIPRLRHEGQAICLSSYRTPIKPFVFECDKSVECHKCRLCCAIKRVTNQRSQRNEKGTGQIF